MAALNVAMNLPEMFTAVSGGGQSTDLPSTLLGIPQQFNLTNITDRILRDMLFPKTLLCGVLLAYKRDSR